MALAAAAATQASASRRRVRLDVTEGIGTFWLMPLMSGFLKANPGINLDWHLAGIPREIGRETDISVRTERPAEPDAVFCALGDFRHALFASATYVLERAPPRNMGDLSGHHLLQCGAYDAISGLAAWNAVLAANPPAVRIENASAAPSLLRAAPLIALLPEQADIQHPWLVRLDPDPGVSVPAWLAWHRTSRRDLQVMAVVGEIRRLAASGQERRADRP